jgi:hypothetical protein
MMKSLRRTIAAAALLMLVAGCSTIPESANDDTGILVIPVRHVNYTDEESYGRYQIYVRDGEERLSIDRVPEGRRMVIVPDLQPGGYDIDVEFWYDGTAQEGTDYQTRSSTVKARTITINAYYMRVEMTYDENDNMYWIWGRFHRTTDEIRDEVIAELAKGKNFSEWEIYKP